MQIKLEELRVLIAETVSRKLHERKLLNEGPREIQIRMAMEDIKDVVVSSIAEDLMRELGMEEGQIMSVVGRAYDKMIRDVVMELDSATPGSDPGTPRRRIVAPMGAPK